MSWSTPKVDWATDDAVGTDDFERIEENTRVAELILGHGVAPESVASAANLDITVTNNIFIITGAVQIDYIKTTGRAAGSIIHLIFASTPTLKNNQGSAPTGYAKMLLCDITDFSGSYLSGDLDAVANLVLAMLYDGTQWRLIH
jgi:hypothetical protein